VAVNENRVRFPVVFCGSWGKLRPAQYPRLSLHESCVRALQREQRQRQREQRQRQREQRQREVPKHEGEAGGDDETAAARKPWGIIMGFQIDAGDFNDRKNDYINLRPSLAYLNSFGNSDIFLSAFYTSP
jgi:hypothetical protein